jgi:O-antigen/teichoic acid export membrane protein
MVSEFAGLVGTGVAVILTRDFTAVIYGLVARALGVVVVSHIVAKRPYRPAWASEYGRGFAQFALPLAFNGALLFLGGQGDRLLVGGALGAAALGQYTAILLLISNPVSAVGRFLASTHLPQFAAARADPPTLLAEEERLSGSMLLMGLLAMAGFAAVAPFVTPLLFGPRFAAGAELFALIGVFQSLRFLRTWPTTVALGAGASTIVMMNNIARMIAFPAALLGQLIVPGLHTIVGGFILGELAALLTAVLLLGRVQPATLAPGLIRIGLFCLISAAVVIWAWAVEGGHTVWIAPAAVASVALSALIVRHERAVLRDFRSFVTKRLKRT